MPDWGFYETILCKLHLGSLLKDKRKVIKLIIRNWITEIMINQNTFFWKPWSLWRKSVSGNFYFCKALVASWHPPDVWDLCVATADEIINVRRSLSVWLSYQYLLLIKCKHLTFVYSLSIYSRFCVMKRKPMSQSV